MQIREHVSLREYTTFKIGGAARYFAEVHTEEEIVEAIRFAMENDLPVFVLGGGSNILVSDEGFGGLVLHLVGRTADALPTVESENDHELIVVIDAGMNWDELVRYAVEHDLYGIEHLSGIPGTVGGAVVANIGAYGAQCSDVFVSAEVIDCKDDSLIKRNFEKKDCAFTYHDSVFGQEHERYIITRVKFVLHKQATQRTQYTDNHFRVGGETQEGGAPTLHLVREQILSIREQKGALAAPTRTSFLCAGSFFHMPFVSREEYVYILGKAQALDCEKEERLRPWAWEQSDGRYKLAPGFLLEYTQFTKGYSRVGVGISPRHTLTIINLGNGTAHEVALLASDMQRAVAALFNVTLEREVEYIGNVS